MNKAQKTIDTSPFRKGTRKGNAGNNWDPYRQAEFQKKLDEAWGGFESIEYKDNLWSGAKNQFAGAENFSEDLTVNQQQAQFQAQQGNQQRSDIMGSLKGAAGGSGVAGLAQAMANQGQIQNQQISASIGQQESANQAASAAGATAAQTQRMQGAADNQKIQLQGAADAKNRELQVQQGKLSFLAGQVDAAYANEDADYRKSDRKLKKNINLIGRSPKGLNIYSFEYKNSSHGIGLFQGVMSDEVSKEAVKIVNGYDTVNYSMLDVEFKSI